MITTSRIQTINEKIRNAISQIEKEENVKISFSKVKYNSAYFLSQMKVETLEKSENVTNVYVNICKNLGFTQNIIGMKFNGPNGVYEIVDIKPRNRKYPVIAKIESGIMYKYTVDQIKTKIGGDKIINRNANLDKLIEN